MSVPSEHSPQGYKRAIKSPDDGPAQFPKLEPVEDTPMSSGDVGGTAMAVHGPGHGKGSKRSQFGKNHPYQTPGRSTRANTEPTTNSNVTVNQQQNNHYHNSESTEIATVLKKALEKDEKLETLHKEIDSVKSEYAINLQHAFHEIKEKSTQESTQILRTQFETQMNMVTGMIENGQNALIGAMNNMKAEWND